MFKNNEGILDRVVRVTLGIVLLPAGLFWLGGLREVFSVWWSQASAHEF